MTLRGLSLPRLRMFAALGLIALPLTLGIGMVRAELTGPTVQDRQITLAVTRYMREGHISRHELNDEIAERTLSNFLKTLDVQKVYFYQSDVESFDLQEHDLDDLIRRGNTEFAFQVFNVYQKPNGVQILMPNGERKPFKSAKLCSDWMKVIGAKE